MARLHPVVVVDTPHEYSQLRDIYLPIAVGVFVVRVGIPYEDQVWFFRVAALLGPIVVYVVVKRTCEQLRASGARPLRGWTVAVVRRTPTGGFESEPPP